MLAFKIFLVIKVGQCASSPKRTNVEFLPQNLFLVPRHHLAKALLGRIKLCSRKTRYILEKRIFE